MSVRVVQPDGSIVTYPGKLSDDDEALRPCPWCGHPPMCHKEGKCVKEDVVDE
jgi:hypothetical protein